MDKLHKITLAMTALICTAIIAVAFITRPQVEVAAENYTVPSWDSNALAGIPQNISDKANYSSLDIPISAGRCSISLAATPEINDNMIDIYFTSSSKNTVWVKLVIFDEAGGIIGQSGLLGNGEYVESVKLEGTASVGQQIKAKILTYEAETYYSMGSAEVTLTIR